MIDAKQMQDGRLKIVNGHQVLGNVKANLVAGAVHHATLDSGTGKPATERACMMTPAGDAGRRLIRAAPELGGKYHQCVLQHTARFQIFEQSGDRLVDVAREFVVVGHVRVRVPVVVDPRVSIDQLNEPHAALGQPAGDHALPAKALRVAALEPVKAVCRVSFVAKIERLRRLGLHAVRGFERFDPRLEVRVALPSLQMLAVKKLEQAKLGLLHLGRGGAAVHVRDRLGSGNDPRTLMKHGKKVRSPNLTPGIRQPGRDDHE